MPLATLVVVLMLGIEVFRPLRELRELLHAGMLGSSSAEAIMGLLGETPAIADAPGAAAGARRLEPTVAFEDVSFAYPGGRGPARDHGLGLEPDVGRAEVGREQDLAATARRAHEDEPQLALRDELEAAVLAGRRFDGDEPVARLHERLDLGTGDGLPRGIDDPSLPGRRVGARGQERRGEE